ncbi:MAG: hypothetical protein Q7R96_06605 [Nanoarchaeota archaeon]|nr:hypothetical protein [Nanoarchaeota archaeon]
MNLSRETVNQLLEEQLGKDTLPLIELIFSKENVSEFKLAEKLNITVNQVRSILYRLQEKNLVQFTRKKDKKKGWYVYFWTLDMKETRALFLKVRKKQLEYHQQQLGLEQAGSFFSCKSKCCRIPFEQALEVQFRCGECGELLNQEQNPKIQDQLKKQIEQLQHDIEVYSVIDVDAEEQPEQKTKKTTPQKKKILPKKKPAKQAPKNIKKKVIPQKKKQAPKKPVKKGFVGRILKKIKRK